MRHLKFRSYLVSVVFICLISFPFLNDKLHLVKDIKSTENRRMRAEPDFKISLLDPFPEEYEHYYNDTFSLRSVFVKCYDMINIKVFKKSPRADLAIIGNNGWLFLGGNELESYRRKDSLTIQQMQAITNELEYRKKYLENRGCKFYFVICPTKQSVYPEYMPSNIYRYSTISWGQQLIQYLDKNSDINVIDIFSALKKNKDKGLLYFKRDNHWNELGAFYAANEVLKNIHKDIPAVNPLDIKDITVKIKNFDAGNISFMLSNVPFDSDRAYLMEPKEGFKAKEVQDAGYPGVEGFPYNWEFEKDREIKGSNKPRLLFISDSYGENIFPFLSEEFSRSVKIFDAWRYRLNSNIVKAEKPDVFILMLLEPYPNSIVQYKSED
jgi:hypothetical protein